MMFITSYWKGQSMTKRDRLIARFLPDELADLLLQYLVVVRPVEIYAMNQLGTDELKASYFNFPFVIKGKPIDSDVLRDAFTATWQRLADYRLTFLQYRHIAYSFASRHINTRLNGSVDHDNEDWEGCEGSATYEDIINRQAGRTKSTGTQHYGVMGNDISMLDQDSRSMFRDVSAKWQSLIGIGNRSMVNIADVTVDGKMKGDKVVFQQTPTTVTTTVSEQSPIVHTSITNIITPLTYTHRSLYGSQSLLSQASSLRNATKEHALAVKRLLSLKGEGTMTSVYQGQAIATIAAGKSNVVCVLPTGGGKSLCFFVPALMDNMEKVTVVIVPLVALCKDLEDRAKSYNLSFIRWRKDTTVAHLDGLHLIFVTVELAVGSEFGRAMDYLSERKRLHRLVIDEVHLVWMWKSFRPAMERLAGLRRWFSSFVLLTATLPLSMESTLLLSLAMVEPVIIRAPTPRVNIKYSVRMLPNKRSKYESKMNMMEEAIGFVNMEMTKYFDQRKNDGKFKAIMYCNRVEKAIEVCDMMKEKYEWLKADVYHASLSKERDAVWERWSNGDCRVIVATSAFSCGIDYRYVRLVVNVGVPWSLLEYVQQSGRAGRDEEAAEAVMFVTEDTIKAEVEFKSKSSKEEEEQWMKKAAEYALAESGCLRVMLHQDLDVNPASCYDLGPKVQRCGLCEQSRLEEAPLNDDDFSLVNLDDWNYEEEEPVRHSRQRTIVSSSAGNLPDIPLAINSKMNASLLIANSMFYKGKRIQDYACTLYETFWFNDGEVKKKACVYCFKQPEKKRKSGYHSTVECMKFNRVCLRCLSDDGHQANQCTIFSNQGKRYDARNLCFKCGLPDKDNGGPADHFGDKFAHGCTTEAGDIYRVGCMVAWRNLGCRRMMLDHFEVSHITTLNEFKEWLYETDEYTGISNMARVFVWWFHLR
jgi:superfamily II DNA/RNA helicase